MITNLVKKKDGFMLLNLWKAIIKRIEHHTNPLHILCKFDKILIKYDKVWSKIFRHKMLDTKTVIQEHIKNKKKVLFIFKDSAPK